jgi:hypothetical protein
MIYKTHEKARKMRHTFFINNFILVTKEMYSIFKKKNDLNVYQCESQ